MPPDDEMRELLGDHLRDGAAPGRAYADRGQVIDEIGEHAIRAIDAWVTAHGGELRVLAADAPARRVRGVERPDPVEVYDLPASELTAGEAPPSPDEPRNSL
jgi:hypothetical protein